MDPLTQQTEIEQRFEVLPEEAVIRLISQSVNDDVNNQGRKYNIPQEERDLIAVIMSLVFFGDIHHEDFKKEVVETIDQPDDILMNIADDLYHSHIEPIAPVLERVYYMFNGGNPITDEEHGEAIESDESEPQSFLLPEHKEEIYVPHVENTQEEKEYDLSHDKVLEEIAHPEPNRATPPSYMDSKLGGQTSIPKEEVKVSPYSGSDPYREPPTG